MIKRKCWSEQEVAFMKKHYPTNTAQWVADQLDRPVESVRWKASKLGLKTNKSWLRRHFQKACKAPVKYPVGTITKRQSRGLHIKLEDGTWERLCVVLWEKKYGKIPEGKNLYRISGTEEECDPKHFECLTKGEYLQKHVPNYRRMNGREKRYAWEKLKKAYDFKF